MIYQIQAHAKINIGLNVKKLRSWNPKHKLESLFMLVDEYADEITLEESDTLSVTYYVNNHEIQISNDSVHKSIDFLKKHFNINTDFKINIHKQIPQQAGLGGSSADAGAILKFFIERYSLQLSPHHYKEVALQLGSDIPFFASGYKLCMVSSYGNHLKRIDKQIPKYKIIANEWSCDTKKVFATFDEMHLKQPKNNYKKIIKCLPSLKDCIIINNLEPPVFQINPVLSKFKKDGIVMTGSGAYFVNFYNKGEKNEN